MSRNSQHERHAHLWQKDPSTSNGCGELPSGISNPHGFSSETLAAMGDAATGKNLFGPYHTVRQTMAELDKE